MTIKRIIVAMLCFASALNLLSGCSAAPKGFIHVEGSKIVDAEGNEVWLKGMALGNGVWDNPTEPLRTSQDESSYEDLASMGFNCVRFYLNYALFEDDSNPYVYKDTGFDWIDENIKWAKKNGIGLILNMHYPQGGYQSQGEGSALWKVEENQNRLIALWKEIAKRYADDPNVIGYGLINEPIVPEIESVEESVDQCRDLMQRITDAIREVDNNHIIFAERVCAVQNASGQADWSIDISKLQFLLNDDNTAYEFHTYDPHSFTHQNMEWAGTAGNTMFYPSEESIVTSYIDDWVDCSSAKKIEDLEDGWQLWETSFVSLKENKYNVGAIVFRAADLGADGSAYIDDISLEEYKDGQMTRVIKTANFSSSSVTLHFWSANGAGSSKRSSTGYEGAGFMISGTTSDANATGFRFELKEGYEYKLTAKIKTENAAAGAKVMPRIDLSLASGLTELNEDYLESMLLANIQFGIDNGVPMYAGEFGAARTAFENHRGGDRWVSDMLDLLKERGVHFTYHAYHEGSFGLYGNSADELPAERNDELAQIFIDKLVN